MNHTTLQAGAGLAPVRLDNGCLPLDGFIGTHDDLHVRVLLLEEAVRFALVSIEITSIFDDTRDRFRDLASRALDTAPGNVWITLTHSFCGPHIWPASKVVRVLQTADITAADGTVIAPDGQWGASTEVDEPPICRFQQKQYQGVNYNLYLPEGYDPALRYPLVVFIHDAGVRGRDPKITLMQGNGALTWAKPEWQAKHLCIVVAPPRSARTRIRKSTPSRA